MSYDNHVKSPINLGPTFRTCTSCVYHQESKPYDVCLLYSAHIVSGVDGRIRRVLPAACADHNRTGDCRGFRALPPPPTVWQRILIMLGWAEHPRKHARRAAFAEIIIKWMRKNSLKLPEKEG